MSPTIVPAIDRWLFHLDARSGAARKRLAERIEARDDRFAAEHERGFDLRSHRAFCETRQERLRLLSTQMLQLALARLAELLVDRGNLREDEQPLRAELPGEKCRRSVLVDHRVDADETLAASDDRDASAAARDRNRTRVGEPADCI